MKLDTCGAQEILCKGWEGSDRKPTPDGQPWEQGGPDVTGGGNAQQALWCTCDTFSSKTQQPGSEQMAGNLE